MTGSAILTYHCLDAGGSALSTAPGTFRRQLETLVERGIRVVPLAEVQGTPGAVALTFDDGYKGFLDCALPLLEQYRWPATVFVVSGHVGGRSDWPCAPYPPMAALELMSWSELRQLVQAGIVLGAHGVHQANLAALPEEQAVREMEDCRREIEDHTGQAVEALAYPFGASTPAVRRTASRHFRLACGTALRYVSAADDPLDLPRIDAYYLRSRFWFDHLMDPIGRCYLAARRRIRQLRQPEALA